MRHRLLFSCLLFLALGFLGLAGCGAKTYEDPFLVVNNHEVVPDARMAAVRQIEQSYRDDPRRLPALSHIVWDRGYSDEERQLAIDQYVAADEAKFRQDAALHFKPVLNHDNPEMVKYLLDLAVRRGWSDLTPAIVRYYAEGKLPFLDADRPERAALLALNPGKSIEEIVFGVFSAPDGAIPFPQRVGSWSLLCRLTSVPRLKMLLAGAPDTTPLVIDLKACAQDLSTFPHNREGVARLEYLRDPSRKAFWDAAKARVAKLTPEQRQGLGLRHLPALLAMDEATLAMDGDAIYRDLVRTLAANKHYTRNPTFDGLSRDKSQAIQEYHEQLCWGDLATIRLLCGVLADRQAAAAFFSQADADERDKSTEYGGVLTWAEGGFVPHPYKPLRAINNTRFEPSGEMVAALYTGVAHYHFHAQEFSNADFAGPGMGDLRLADYMDISCIVLTFINRDTLNVDYYQPGQAVVDLGIIQR